MHFVEKTEDLAVSFSPHKSHNQQTFNMFLIQKKLNFAIKIKLNVRDITI